jgi:hypothetical protein
MSNTDIKNTLEIQLSHAISEMNKYYQAAEWWKQQSIKIRQQLEGSVRSQQVQPVPGSV